MSHYNCASKYWTAHAACYTGKKERDLMSYILAIWCSVMVVTVGNCVCQKETNNTGERTSRFPGFKWSIACIRFSSAWRLKDFENMTTVSVTVIRAGTILKWKKKRKKRLYSWTFQSVFLLSSKSFKKMLVKAQYFGVNCV